LPPRDSHAGIVANKKRIASNFLDTPRAELKLGNGLPCNSRFENGLSKKLHIRLESFLAIHQGNETPQPTSDSKPRPAVMCADAMR
jgi:hypothetical protein